MTDDRRPATPLVIQTAFLGDTVLTTPLLSALAERHGPVDVVTTPGAATLLASHPAVRQVIGYDKRGTDRGFAGFWRLAKRLRETGYPRVYLPHRSWRSASLALAARIPERIGFADAPAARTYTSRVARAPSGHETDRLLALAWTGESLGGRVGGLTSGRGGGSASGRGGGPASGRVTGLASGLDATIAAGEAGPRGHGVSLALTEADQAEADTWLRTAGLAGAFVAVAPGSIWGTKRWPYYAELVRGIELPAVVIGGPDDAVLADSIVAAAPERARSAAGQLSLRASAALIQRAAVLVTNDSAPLHLATAVRTPIIAIFGPTVPEFGFGPLGPTDRVLGVSGLPCRPCSTHGPQVCPLGHHRCMRDLDAELVIDAVRAIIHGEERSALRARD